MDPAWEGTTVRSLLFSGFGTVYQGGMWKIPAVELQVWGPLQCHGQGVVDYSGGSLESAYKKEDSEGWAPEVAQ